MIDELRDRLYEATNGAASTEQALDHAVGLYQEAASLIDALESLSGRSQGRHRRDLRRDWPGGGCHEYGTLLRDQSQRARQL